MRSHAPPLPRSSAAKMHTRRTAPRRKFNRSLASAAHFTEDSSPRAAAAISAATQSSSDLIKLFIERNTLGPRVGECEATGKSQNIDDREKSALGR